MGGLVSAFRLLRFLAPRILCGASLSKARLAIPLLKIKTFCYADSANNLPEAMDKKPTKKVFRFAALVDGRLIAGDVSFSPAPRPGVLTELARWEAERI